MNSAHLELLREIADESQQRGNTGGAYVLRLAADELDAARAAAPQAQPVAIVGATWIDNGLTKTVRWYLKPEDQPLPGTLLYLAAPERADDRVRQEALEIMRGIVEDWNRNKYASGLPESDIRQRARQFVADNLATKGQS